MTSQNWWDLKEEELKDLTKRKTAQYGQFEVLAFFKECRWRHEKEMKELCENISFIREVYEKNRKEGMVKVDDVLKIIDELNSFEIIKQYSNGDLRLDAVKLAIKNRIKALAEKGDKNE